MSHQVGSQRIQRTQVASLPFMTFIRNSTWAKRDLSNPNICDFVFGNPHEPPLPEFVTALQQHSIPQDNNWFGYTRLPAAYEMIAASLRERRGVAYESDDVFLTNGAFSALTVSLCALVDPGDDVIFISPPWFFYEPMVIAFGATPRRVKIDTETLDLDLDAIAEAITKQTRAIIINSPHNPTGKIYPPETLERLAQLLAQASERHGHTIYLLSDEAYSRIVFDGRDYPSPTEYYPNALLLYTYGKTLLTPGQRLGYIALPPSMPEREPLRNALFTAQLVTGYAFPNTLLQHALVDIDQLSIDISHLQRKRDRMVAALQGMGYEVHVPEGTFYLLVKSPIQDDVAFMEELAKHHVYCLPGAVYELPGTFRISLTANEEMIERALPKFASAIQMLGKTDTQVGSARKVEGHDVKR